MSIGKKEKQEIQYNTCGICGAGNGRAGILIGNTYTGFVHACLNCHDTRTNGVVTIHSNLIRTNKEIQKTINIIKTLNK